MSMVFHDCSEVPPVEERDPILETLFNDQSIIGSRSRISASWIDWIMVISKSIQLWVLFDYGFNFIDLILIIDNVARVHVEQDSRADLMVMV